ncbi:MAG TPA: MarP family serine protease [Candidatus Saccharimonadales bacterium]|nr:MarP family serine protease [Candidatus Saccharimonadales bacterium]
MNWLDLFIIVFLIAALLRGTEVGFVRQFFSTAGFFLGLFLGAWAQGNFIHMAGAPESRALFALLFILGIALVGMTAGEYVGLRLKFKLRETDLGEKLDRVFGSALAVVTLLAAVWLGAAIFRGIPDGPWQRQIGSSRVIGYLDSTLPSAPNVLTKLGHLIDPNGFPQVFTGLEPKVKTDTPLPDMGEFNSALQTARASVVKIGGQGCGGIVQGTGFIASERLVITNAHVVAGVNRPMVIDQTGQHRATVVWFNPDLDLAILRTNELTGPPLVLSDQVAQNGTPVAVLGYPGGGDVAAAPAVILESFTARGRNIYNEGSTRRHIYSFKGDVEQGNSGGPLLAKDGSVAGIIFAKSTSYSQVGYALVMEPVLDALNQAKATNQAVGTGACAQ